MKKIEWKEIRKLEVVAEGFSVRIAHRFYLHYIEGSRTMKIGIEVTPGISDVIFKEGLRWLPPYDSEMIPSGRLDEIKERVHQALGVMEVPHKFVLK